MTDIITDIFGDSLEPEYFVQKIQDILDQEHDLPEKKKIRRYPNNDSPKRINFACPYCGDSEKVRSKKRGNLYLNTLIFRCFNCGEKGNFTKLCQDFHQNITAEDRLKMYNYVDSRTFSKGEDYQMDSLEKLIPILEWIQFMNQHSQSWLTDIEPIINNSKADQYLKSRYIHNHDSIYQGIYQKFKDGKRVYWTPVIILLNRNKDKLLGIQLRNLESNRNKRFFKIVDFEELYNYLHPESLLDEMEAISYNKLSHFYNILNVNFEKPVTIFEGYIDSLFYPNSIGLVGANNDEDLLKFFLEAEENLDLRFFYDNDKTGIEKANKMMKKGYPVFLWVKMIETLLQKTKNKSQAENILKPIIDLNELVCQFKDQNLYLKFKMENYYSLDSFDSIYLPLT